MLSAGAPTTGASETSANAGSVHINHGGQKGPPGQALLDRSRSWHHPFYLHVHPHSFVCANLSQRWRLFFSFEHNGKYILFSFGEPVSYDLPKLLGREYYLTNFGEKALVLVPITAHVLSAWLKRVSSSKPATEPRRWQNPLSITGYAVGLLLFPIHYLTHRAYPAQEAAPVLGVGPSELDFEFVKLGLQTWPVRSWLMYGTLTIFTTFHLSIGAGILWSTYIRPAFPKLSLPSLKIRNRLALGCIALPTLTGLFFVSREPLMTFSSTAKRYTAALLTSSVYRIGF